MTDDISSVDWTTLAHIQLVRQHLDICNAVMLFAELSFQKSPAQRLLLYPKEWDSAITSRNNSDPTIETSKRLLKLAAKSFDVSLLPIEPMEGISNSKYTHNE